MQIRNIAVFGAGTMGHGIAQVSAMAGYKVTLFDIAQGPLDSGLQKIKANLQKGVDKGKITSAQQTTAVQNITVTTSMETACADADLTIEAIPEKLEMKKNLLQKIDSLTGEKTIIASNTSSISIETIAQFVADPSRVIGAHFFNPVHIMKLLEIVYHPTTDASVIKAIQDYGNQIEKETILVKNTPGFATSRLGVALGMEAIRMLEEGVASAEDIDKAMVLGYKHPIGPLKLTDLVGIDVRMHIGEYLSEKLNNPAFSPPKLMRDKVAQGKLGKKTKEGFYRW